MGPHHVQQLGRSHNTTPTESMPNAYNGYLSIPYPERWSFPLLSQMKNFLLQTAIESLFNFFYSNCIILHILF